MREILFRGKTEQGEWVYGYLIKGNYNTGFGIIEDHIDMGLQYVKEETIGQFTGLTDKKGTKIFEEDIVQICRKFIYGNGEYNFYKVIWHEDWNGWGLINIKSAHSRYLEGACYGEVIGNIHDNPELLGE